MGSIHRTASDHPAGTGARRLPRAVRLFFGLIAWALAAAATSAACHAQTPGSDSSQFRHDRWMVYEGAPAGMRAIAQTPDGWIWITGADGLFRFDGVSFEQIPVPAGSRLARASPGPLLVTRSGELWVGYAQNGGVAVYRNGHLDPVPMPQPPASIASLAETPDGSIWAASNLLSYERNRLYRLTAGRWEDAGARLNLPVGYASNLCVTKDGTLWLTLDESPGYALVYLRPGGSRFQIRPHPVAGQGCFSDRRGRLWVASRSGPTLSVGADGQTIARPIAIPNGASVASVLLGVDSSGGFWGWAKGTGIFYLPDPAAKRPVAQDRPERFAAPDGLSSNVLYHLFVDRDDNVWVAGELGLERFRKAAIQPDIAVKGAFDNGFGLVQTGPELYVTSDQGTFQVSPGRSRKIVDGAVTGECSARDKGGWLLRDNQIVHFHDGTQNSFPAPRGLPLISFCGEDRFGRLWAGNEERRLIWHDDRGWHVPSSPYPAVQWWKLVRTSAGDIAYTTDKDLVRLIGNKVDVLPLGRYDPGFITNISAGGDDLYVSGNNGLLRIRGNHVAKLDWRRFPWVARLRDLLQTPSGETWLMRGYFTSRVATADLNRAFDDPGAPLNRVVLDMRDGLRPPQSNDFDGPQLGVGADGRVWQLSRGGATYIDSSRVSAKAPPPPVVVRSLTAGGILQRDPAALTLPPGTRTFDIAYTALAYAHPERLRFKYRLEGIDDDWIDAGDRRVASYGNLRPGHFRFRVIASDDQHRWSNPGASLDIEIRPTFFESWPFMVIGAAALLALLWLAYSIRLRVVADRIRMVMAERMAERERIARELHDTLLQGCQGLMLRFQAATNRVRDAEVRRSLDIALDQAEAILVEGRERVRDLRNESESGELAEMVADIARAIVPGDGPRLHLSVDGDQRPLQALVAIETLRIAEEAIRNAVFHAASESIAVSLSYERKRFRLLVSDTGAGIPEAMLAGSQRSGHFGLVGMRERARRIGGRLDIVTRTGEGTQVMLTVPAHAAYADGSGDFLAPLHAFFRRRWRS